MTEGSRATELLADRPELEAPLQDLLEIDEAHETWTFDDISLDSGTFGQLVSEGVVEKVDGEYRLAEPDAVRRALGEQPTSDDTERGSVNTPSLDEVSLSLPSVDGRAAAMLAGALTLIVVIRSYVVGSVFRPDAVVLAANDPYYYRYWVEQAFAEGMVGGLPIAEVPEGIALGEPFLVATLAWVSGLLGGVDASGAVLAVYPVVAAVLVGLGLYFLTMVVTADRRVALSAVLMLAVTPASSLRTALGFADHHAFDFVWLILTALALAVLVSSEREGPVVAVLGALGVGVGVTGQVLAWDNGPLLVVPLAAVVVGVVLLAVREGRSPVREAGPILGGLALAAGVTYAVHTTVGWHTQTVALTPAIFLGGALAIVAVGEGAYRFDLGVRVTAGVEAVAGLGSVAGVAVFLPDYWSRAIEGLGRITQRQDIAEVESLFSGDTLGFLLLFGFVLFIAVPALAWATVQLVDGTARWLVPAAYGWYFLVLAVFQVRFAGELSPFTALFAGVGFVWLAEKVDLARPLSTGREFAAWVPGRVDRSTVSLVLALFVLVAGLSVVQSAIKVEQVTTDDASYETAAAIASFADEHGWDNAEESYVLSNWGENRMYNYFVNGQSRSYGYARSVYGSFLNQSDPDAATEELVNRVRFVVIEDGADANRMSMQARLHQRFGSRGDGVAGLGQFRAMYATNDRTAFVRVPGARLSGTVGSNTTVSVATNVSIPGASFTYERWVRSGNVSVRVAYPGTYNVRVGEQLRTVAVSEAEVLNGTRVSIGE
ncbi:MULTISPECIES: STT3 domain-containing protein [Salinibaculum]|uniref:STT3 domain-containing protein n=1 Tax=Salinibaculum TaxID=2732368 RepID=UPI0030D52CB1